MILVSLALASALQAASPTEAACREYAAKWAQPDDLYHYGACMRGTEGPAFDAAAAAADSERRKEAAAKEAERRKRVAAQEADRGRATAENMKKIREASDSMIEKGSTLGPCASAAERSYVAKLIDSVERFGDARSVADVTAKIALSGQVQRLQEIARDIKSQVAATPKCASVLSLSAQSGSSDDVDRFLWFMRFGNQQPMLEPVEWWTVYKAEAKRLTATGGAPRG